MSSLVSSGFGGCMPSIFARPSTQDDGGLQCANFSSAATTASVPTSHTQPGMRAFVSGEAVTASEHDFYDVQGARAIHCKPAA